MSEVSRVSRVCRVGRVSRVYRVSRFESSERRKGRKLRGDNDGHEERVQVSVVQGLLRREFVVMLLRAVE